MNLTEGLSDPYSAYLSIFISQRMGIVCCSKNNNDTWTVYLLMGLSAHEFYFCIWKYITKYKLHNYMNLFYALYRNFNSLSNPSLCLAKQL